MLLYWSTLVLCFVATIPVKPNRCGTGIPDRCSCTNHTLGAVNIFCDRLGLQDLPNLDFDITPIHTFSLEGNNLTSIQTGDFFGLKVTRLLLKRNQISDLNLLAFWGLEYHLDSLDLGYNQLSKVPADALRLLRNLRTLSLEGNKISTLHNSDFASLDRLEVLTLDHNPIATVEADAFRGTNLYLLSIDAVGLPRGLQSIPTKDLNNLKGLSLADNGIEEIPAGWFRALSSLRSLNLDSNRIHTITPEAFDGIHDTIVTLEINKNKIKKIPKKALRNLKQLESLEMTHNRIRKIHARSFNSSKKLMELDLSHNHISDISPVAFEGATSLEKVDLRSNALFTLDEKTFFFENAKVREVRQTDRIYHSSNLFLRTI